MYMYKVQIIVQFQNAYTVAIAGLTVNIILNYSKSSVLTFETSLKTQFTLLGNQLLLTFQFHSFLFNKEL